MSEKIKVLHVISDTNIGGAGKYLITYCQNRNKDRFDISVLVPKESLLVPELKKTGAHVIEIDGIKDDSKDFKSYKKIKKVIDDIKPDIVHTHASIVGRLASKRSKTKPKIVFSKHCDFEPSKVYSYKLTKKIFGKLNSYLADKIIATSNHSKESLIKQGIKEDLIISIPNGTNGFQRQSNELILKTKEKYNLKNEKTIGYVARLVELKGHKTLFDAIKILKSKSNIDFKCLVVGDGDYKEELIKYAKELDIEDKVIFTGFIKNVEEILNIIDVQVNCSYLSETTNIALLEGMSLGIPTVATNIGGTPDMIKDDINGYIVDLKDSKEMADKLIKVLNDERLYLKLSENSKKIFNEKYTSTIFAKNIEKVYENLIK